MHEGLCVLTLTLILSTQHKQQSRFTIGLRKDLLPEKPSADPLLTPQPLFPAWYNIYEFYVGIMSWRHLVFVSPMIIILI